MILMIVWQLKF